MELSGQKHGQNYINGGITKMNRFKSWALWLSVSALIVFCVKEFMGMDISETVNGFLNMLLPVLIGFGIVNNPTEPGHI